MDERKECEITLSLSNEECKLISLKAESKGMTVSELLQQFISDLVEDNFERKHNYEQHQLAEAWYNQAFSEGGNYNFVQYLLETTARIEEYLEHVDEIEEVSLFGEGKFFDNISDEIDFCERILKSYYSDYERECEYIGYAAEPFEEAHKRVIEWRKTSLYKV